MFNMINNKSMLDKFKLDNLVATNFKKVTLGLLIPPFLMLFLFFMYFAFYDGSSFVDNYVESQKQLFYFLNGKLAVHPNLQLNLTHLGDALILYPLIIVFLFYASKLWEVVLTSSIMTLIISAMLKKIFAVPRPAAMFDVESFEIVGRTLTGATALPSGHSMTAFMVISVLLFAFMPKRKTNKILWSVFILAIGFIIALSRVGVGAHYPGDVLIGCAIGFIVAIIGIAINNNLSWLDWIKNKKFYPVFMVVLIIWSCLIVTKIIGENLPVFYLSLFSLVGTLYLITNAYIKKN